MEKNHIEIQYKRLRRHYEVCKDGYDEVVMLDLTHTLRVWGEMAKDVDELIKAEGLEVKFLDNQKTKKIKDTLTGGSYTYLPLAGATEVSGIMISDVKVYDRALTPEEIKKNYEAGRTPVVNKKLSFREWLHADVLEKRNNKGERISISRSILIKRNANMLGASHPKGKEDKDVQEKRFDSFILELNEIKLNGDYPVGYYHMIEFAEIIIQNIAPIFEDKNKEV